MSFQLQLFVNGNDDATAKLYATTKKGNLKHVGDIDLYTSGTLFVGKLSWSWMNVYVGAIGQERFSSY